MKCLALILTLCLMLGLVACQTTPTLVESEVDGAIILSSSDTDTEEPPATSETTSRVEESSIAEPSSSSETPVDSVDEPYVYENGYLFRLIEVPSPSGKMVSLPAFNVPASDIVINAEKYKIFSAYANCELEIDLFDGLSELDPFEVLTGRCDTIISRLYAEGYSQIVAPDIMADDVIMVRYITAVHATKKTIYNAVLILGMVSETEASVVKLVGEATESEYDKTVEVFNLVCESIGLVAGAEEAAETTPETSSAG